MRHSLFDVAETINSYLKWSRDENYGFRKPPIRREGRAGEFLAPLAVAECFLLRRPGKRKGDGVAEAGTLLCCMGGRHDRGLRGAK